MPYRVEGNKVMHQKGGKWSVKQVAGSHAKALAAMRLLYGIESGDWKPTGKPARGKRRKLSDHLKAKRG